ncbi:MAG TPA: hypothetical protein VF134_08805 [Candidatus Dormibacteraeota bacterium]
MLGYIFWHWPDDPAADREAYEAAQRAFHRALAATRSEGFIRSLSFRVQGLPWLGAPEGKAYEDWYLLEGSYALDPLNELAVSASVRDAHAGAANGATGAGALYRLARGVPEWGSGEVAWVAKPRGEHYAGFYARFPDEGVVWRRQMVLGPATEFVAEGAPPDGLEALRVRRELFIET